jgi:hypothetical protein
MPRHIGIVAAFSIAAVAAAARADTSAPLRHLVYSFTFESKQTGTPTNDTGTSGARTYTGNLDDTGTIAVDVLREASDRGLVVVVSEQAKTRSAEPATCAVYGNTNVACDTGRRVNREEFTLLRFLGANFVDPNKVDTSGQWSISETNEGTKMTAQYTIKSNNNGVLAIDETRHVEDTTQGSTTFDARTTLDYNGPKLVPTSVDEYATERRSGGVTGNYTTIYQTTLSLVSDSMAAKH